MSKALKFFRDVTTELYAMEGPHFIITQSANHGLVSVDYSSHAAWVARRFHITEQQLYLLTLCYHIDKALHNEFGSRASHKISPEIVILWASIHQDTKYAHEVLGLEEILPAKIPEPFEKLDSTDKSIDDILYDQWDGWKEFLNDSQILF